jgi:hypothetical protein
MLMYSRHCKGHFTCTESQTKNADWKILPAQSEAVHGTRWRGPARGEGNV